MIEGVGRWKMGRPKVDPAVSLRSRIHGCYTKDESGCWLWSKAITKEGYGRLSRGGKDNGMIYGHRAMYEVVVGPIPPGYQIDHLCRVRHCVNPDHLEAVTPWENNRRSFSTSAINLRKTDCPFGHGPLVVRNNGFRGCDACYSLNETARYAAKLLAEGRGSAKLFGHMVELYRSADGFYCTCGAWLASAKRQAYRVARLHREEVRCGLVSDYEGRMAVRKNTPRKRVA